MPRQNPGSRTLFIRLSSLGDVVLTEPTIRAYKLARPGEEIHFLTKSTYCGLVGMLPSVDRVISTGEGPLTARRLASIIRSLRKRGYDSVIDLQNNLRSNAISMSAGRAGRHSYDKASLKRRLMPLGFYRDLGVKHTSKRYLSSLDGMGLGTGDIDHRPRIDPGDASVEAARKIMPGLDPENGHKLVAVVAGARWPSKRWPAGYFAEVVKTLQDRAGALCVLVGDESDRAVAGEVLSHIGGKTLDLTGLTDLCTLAGVLRMAKLTITNDSGPMHLSAAVGTPVLAVFGPTTPTLGFAPLGSRDRIFQVPLDCRPCSIHGSKPCRRGDPRCLTEVTPDGIAGEALKILGEH